MNAAPPARAVALGALLLALAASPATAQEAAGAKDLPGSGLPPCAPDRAVGDVPPCLKKRIEPLYSEKARQANIQGEVQLDVIVTPEGKVGSVVIVQSLDTRFGLDQRAIAAVRQWEYEPARRNGEPVQRLVQLSVPFRIPGVEPAPRQTPVADVIPADVVRPQTPGLVPPRLKRQVPPVYTSTAMRAKLTGSVLIEAVVLADGTVGPARVIRALDGAGLDQQALGAAREWEFEPATLNGKPVASLVRFQLEFRLH